MQIFSKQDHRNSLAKETSPYLLQHAGNPVDWYPWGETALKKAQQEDKMLLISIGYSACHWCHVMEHESFEDEEVARVMNQHFVCVKVDREERPDVDQVYMNAVQLLNGSGGWPLNCFALPDGSPVYGGTYFPRENWLQVLEYMAGIYQNEREKAIQQAEALKSGIQQSEFIPQKVDADDFTPNDLKTIYRSIQANYDPINGGLGQAPKFPMPCIWLFLLRYSQQSKDESALKHSLLTLNKIARAGIHDQIGGGFSRYATDAQWNIPHFEKMLYDNGQLLSLYSEAYQLTRDEYYKEVAYMLVDFVSSELSAGEGAFYSSLDADSEDEEGKYYVWTREEIEQLLGDEADLYCDFYSIARGGNWEHGKNILFPGRSMQEFAEIKKLDPAGVAQQIKVANGIMLKERKKRIPPGLDDKILTSWNALMINGLAVAYRAFGDDAFLKKAVKAAEFILEKQSLADHHLMRCHKKGRSTIPAFLDDYAHTTQAFLSLYRATFNEEWLQHAHAYTAYAIEHFFDPNSGMFFYTDSSFSELTVRKMELSDNVIPASNSVMANNLFMLSVYFDKPEYSRMARQMVLNVKESTLESGAYFSNWGNLILNLVDPPNEIAISGPESEAMRKELEQHYLPGLIVAGSDRESELPLLRGRYHQRETRVFVCRDYACRLPVYGIDAALELLRE